jgi:hypothetical protein
LNLAIKIREEKALVKIRAFLALSESISKVSNLSEFSVQTWNGNGFNELIKSNITSSGKEIDRTGITEMHTTYDAQLTGFGNVFRSGGDPNDKFSGVAILFAPFFSDS